MGNFIIKKSTQPSKVGAVRKINALSSKKMVHKAIVLTAADIIANRSNAYTFLV